MLLKRLKQLENTLENSEKIVNTIKAVNTENARDNIEPAHENKKEELENLPCRNPGRNRQPPGRFQQNVVDISIFIQGHSDMTPE